MTSRDCCFYIFLLGLCLIGWLIQGRRCLTLEGGEESAWWWCFELKNERISQIFFLSFSSFVKIIGEFRFIFEIVSVWMHAFWFMDLESSGDSVKCCKHCECGCSDCSMAAQSSGNWLRSVKRKHKQLEQGDQFSVPGPDRNLVVPCLFRLHGCVYLDVKMRYSFLFSL